MENGEKKPTIDERIAAIAQSVELLSVNVHAMQEKQARQDAQQADMDARERRGRAAILAGVAAYLQALQDGGDAPA